MGPRIRVSQGGFLTSISQRQAVRYADMTNGASLNFLSCGQPYQKIFLNYYRRICGRFFVKFALAILLTCDYNISYAKMSLGGLSVEKMIDTIVEMDKKARLRAQEAEEYRDNQMKALDSKLKEIDETYRANTDRELERLAAESAEQVRRRTQEIERASSRAADRLEQAYREGADGWVDAIVKRTLAGE